MAKPFYLISSICSGTLLLSLLVIPAHGKSFIAQDDDEPAKPVVKREAKPARPSSEARASVKVVAGKDVDSFRDCADSSCPEMIWLPQGSYQMGSSPKEAGRYDNEGPVHAVSINYPLAVGKYEVTFAQWDACVAAGGCSRRPEDEGWGRGNRPVINVSWDDTQQYLKWLNQKTGKKYRLLSESEWEYAARGGSQSAYPWGNAVGRNQANCDGCGSQWDYKQTAPVGSFQPNGFGLYDVVGNVREWVADCWHDTYRNAPSDGSVWPGGDCSRRVLRGESWGGNPQVARVAFRNRYNPASRDGDGGFRLARTQD